LFNKLAQAADEVLRFTLPVASPAFGCNPASNGWTESSKIVFRHQTQIVVSPNGFQMIDVGSKP
jgi:hypothetical protein